MSEDSTGGFFQFPLCLLATREPMEQWLTRAFHYAVVEFADSTSDSKIYFPRLKYKDQKAELARVAKVMGFNGGNPDAFINGHKAAVSKINEWKARHGSKAEVRASLAPELRISDSIREPMASRP